ncbi:FCS-Like Zinc finger 8-like [Salvia divinorum]|uniref:FCS-Like Zinc finger 8-like n=1 Tax=Salvia divinorum TaxID=28513 RepID=A0ABD1GW41_SALDI
MVWNRSRAVRTKQALMSDQTPLFLSPTKNSPSSSSSSPISSFFNGFLSKSNLDAETTSPTSILDPKIPNFQSPFALDPPLPPPIAPRHRGFEKSIGLALIDSIVADDFGGGDCRFPKPINRLALKVQIPEISSSAGREQSPRSPADFGIKTRGLQATSPFGGGGGKGFVRQLSLKEMEMSEDYTCVIKHGPNPETKHIYDDCVLDDHDPKLDLSQPQIDESKDFFKSSCHACRALLQEDKDIYIYRGEKAFCSQECRCKEMIFEGMENPGAF